MEFTGVKPMGIKEMHQKKLNEVKEGSGDDLGYSYRRFTLMEKLCVR